MRTEKVNFYSEGIKLGGALYLPDSDKGKPYPGIVQGPGFLGLKDAKHYIMMFENADRLATYGSGGTGGGNAVYVAAIDSRVKCCVSYLGVSSGREWLHSMRREYEGVHD